MTKQSCCPGCAKIAREDRIITIIQGVVMVGVPAIIVALLVAFAVAHVAS